MARIPDEPVDPVDELDDLLTEDELLLEEIELQRLDHARPTRLQLEGGAPASFSLLLIVCGLIGLWASVELVLTEMTWLADPLASLGCDINPVLGCGTFLDTWQGHVLFGIPNALVGTAAFGALVAVGVMFLAGARAARWFWQLMCAIVTVGLGFVAWFAHQSMTVIGSLCPYCVVTWFVVIAIAVNVLARAAQARHLPVTQRFARTLVTERWLIIASLYGVIVVLAIVVFWDKWKLVFGL